MSYCTTTNTILPFTLSSPLGTDIWRKPPNIDVFTAPIHPSPLYKHLLRLFHGARITVSLPSVDSLRQFDQAGLILHFTRPSTELKCTKDKWIKTGIEYYEGKPWVSTVGCDAWSDWSVIPLPIVDEESRPKVTIEAERVGKSLWVYQIIKGKEVDSKAEEKLPLRELNWVFAEEEGWEVGIGGFVARETEGDGKDELS
ncbi:hypothetical protein BKA66DRAFT_469242 [Pyrenochaeta sp. MPI-SDFR-AT-0127]|nr:hypothetical protein BKA66DRAFT_469242 [Pyrenochaeta sp. MPI-SDFR-AT-0127]